ncbi:hypothetical protein HBI26_100720 [Parastagonospora nodorum]|nr:hypothetical protein HBI78_190830 [Parastagonospora nodorum]KAH5006977.1 hypothetical protein HBI74_216090 [Parastagonospora nodorum]KAH5210646.1 hypothetical protein HBI62_204120 [Parastagonospora nodorum]KAH5597147.1 hypothetical protein HBI26_100720 [Parastagonospora nodorum]KAH6009917.1 hypothetical protein HBI83_169480 [Parastagonospora nodorum]
MLLSAKVIIASLLAGSKAAFYYPDVQTHLLEHILVDNWGTYASNFSSAITPCTNYVTQIGTAALNSGRTTAAQWMRVLFHDFVTANVSAGTGGVDASIGFETARSENSGSAFNDSFTFWRPFVNNAVSMADLVALGTAMSNNLCGGRNIPYRAGRIDATSAGSTTGVPAPETDLEETLVFFERAGFDKVDSIGLTACGHTMGSVHHGGFPDVVEEIAVTPNNTNGGSNFDSTRGAFDPAVLGEYLHGTGKRGGPLVTSNNVTTRSDLRLYESDQNATMQALFAQGDTFLDTCVGLFNRMMNTVPTGVQLGPVIEALAVKPINVTFDFDAHGKLKLSGKFRILTGADDSPPLLLSFRVSNHTSELLPETATGSSTFGGDGSRYGKLTYFPFSVSGPDLRRMTSFSVESSTVAVQSFAITGTAFVVPRWTTLVDDYLNITLAISSPHTCEDVSLRIATAVPQHGTLAPVLKRTELALSQAKDAVDKYTLCTTVATLDSDHIGLITLKVEMQGQILDTYLVNSGAAGW